MGDVNDMIRRGEISGRAARKGKLGIFKKTKVQSSRMAGQQDDDIDADDKAGLRDQGGRRDKGDRAAFTDHINRNQDMGSPARAVGKPSRGGAVNASQQPVKRGQIDDASQQGPKFPAGSKVRKGLVGTPSRAKGPIAPRGGQYGGGGRNTQ